MSEEQIPITQSSRKQLPVGVRILLSVLSILLCVCLMASMLAAAAILDYRLVTSRSNIEKITNSLLSAPSGSRHLPLTAAVGSVPTAEASESGSQTQEALVEWLYDTLKQQHGDELTVTKEQMQSFLDQSGTKEFLSDKISSYMDDFINGTSSTTITTDEVLELIEENKTLVEQELGVTMDPEAWNQVIDFVEQSDIGTVIQSEVIEGIQSVTIPGASPLLPGTSPDSADPENSAWGGSYTIGALMTELRILTSDMALITVLAINFLLMVALFFTNRMRLSGTLCSIGVPAVVAGTLLALPTALLQLVPGMLPAGIGSVIDTVIGAVAPVHYGLLGLGIATLIGAIVAKALQKK